MVMPYYDDLYPFRQIHFLMSMYDKDIPFSVRISDLNSLLPRYRAKDRVMITFHKHYLFRVSRDQVKDV